MSLCAIKSLVHFSSERSITTNIDLDLLTKRASKTAELSSNCHFPADDAPPEYWLQICEFLKQTFQECWIKRGGPILWPPLSPDITPLDLFSWGCVKDTVHGLAMLAWQPTCFPQTCQSGWISLVARGMSRTSKATACSKPGALIGPKALCHSHSGKLSTMLPSKTSKIATEKEWHLSLKYTQKLQYSLVFLCSVPFTLHYSPDQTDLPREICLGETRWLARIKQYQIRSMYCML